MRVAWTIVMFAMMAPAAAEWRIDTSRDRMTDRDVKTAWVRAVDAASGIQARLEVFCLEDKLVGGLVVRLRTNGRFTPGRMGLAYRVDDGALENRYMPASNDGMSNWGNAGDILRGKRVRVKLEPFNGPSMVFDFDGSGGDAAARAIPCKDNRL